MTGGLGHIHGEAAGGRVETLRLGTVGIASAGWSAFIVVGAEKALAFDPHGQIEQAGENHAHIL